MKQINTILIRFLVALVVLYWTGGVDHCFASPEATIIIQELAEKEPPVWIPDTTTREKIRSVEESDIDYLAFSGHDFVHQEAKTQLIVSDINLIHRFVKALRGAMVVARPFHSRAEEVGNLMDEMAGSPTKWNAVLHVQLKKSNVKASKDEANTPAPSLDFIFRIGASQSEKGRWCFGPTFYQCLKELSKYQAQAIRQKITEVGPKVVGFRFSDSSTNWPDAPLINDATMVQAFVSALKEVDERAYDCTYRYSRGMPALALLQLQDGTTIELHLMPAEIPKNKLKSPVWLRTIWSYMWRPL